MGGAHAQIARELTELQAVVNNEATTMWYFNLYGPNEQSFHAKFAPMTWSGKTTVRT
jgi:hypothetical protein